MLNVTLSGGVKRIQWDLEGIYNWEAMGDIWVKQDSKGFIWSEGRVCERMSCKESQKVVYIYSFAHLSGFLKI